MLEDIEHMSMIHGNDWKLVDYRSESESEFFNLLEDPKELINIWHNDRYRDAKNVFEPS